MKITYKDRDEMIPFAPIAYRKAIRTFVGAMPYSLIYGMEAILPIEVKLPSL